MKDSASKNQQGSKAVANRVVQKKDKGKSLPSPATAQLAGEEEELQLKSIVQRAGPEEELQLKSVVQKAGPEEELQLKSVAQRAGPEEELQLKSVAQRAGPEEELQMKSVAQKKNDGADVAPTNNNGLPGNLKSGIENLSGMSMDGVKVHYNSSKPADLKAHAYAQGTDIHVAPGQEKHLGHEAWHVVQQQQGRVKPTLQMKDSIPINDDPSLEKEADEMGARALNYKK